VSPVARAAAQDGGSLPDGRYYRRLGAALLLAALGWLVWRVVEPVWHPLAWAVLLGTLLAPAQRRLVGLGATRVRWDYPADPDFVVLAGLISARDFREAGLTAKDRTRLYRMLTCCRGDDAAMAVDNAVEALARLERAAGLSR